MALKIKAVSKKLIVILSVLLLGLVTFICFAGQVNVSAASVSDTDKGIYNTNWSIGKVKYYINRQNILGIDKTNLYISLVDENGKHLDNVTKIEMTYFIGGENYHVIKDVEKEHTDSEEKEYQKELKELEKLEKKEAKLKEN